MSASPVTGFSAVESAVRRAADATGVKFDFLMRTARRESGFDADAKAPTSSAAGLFQFVEQTWMGMLKRHGAEHGYANYASVIQQGADGRYHVPDEAARHSVMALRYDPQASAVMAGEMASDHAAYLRGRVGRDPTGGELYMAHFLGPQGSAKLIEANSANPGAAAASLFPEAASANRGVFYRGGQALSVAQVYAGLARTGGDDAVVGPAQGMQLASAAGDVRSQRMKAESELMNLLIGDGSGDQRSAPGSLFSAEMLTLFSEARRDGQG